MHNHGSCYLRSDVKVEPLIEQWYAWSYLIPPATQARTLTERQLPILDSYISAPKIHASAVGNPKMRGGPFIDLGGERVDEIRQLRDRIRKQRKPLIELSAAITALDAMLRDNARGQSLEPLYDKIPDILRGYVELAYDLNNHPSFRLIEPLLYRSSLFERSLQSLVLSPITSDDRPFILSTPRLPSRDSLHLSLSFDDEVTDQLFLLKKNPKPWGEIKEMLEISDCEERLARSLFTTDPGIPYVAYNGPGIRWRYFGHACILIECQKTRILLDPVLSYTYESEIARYTYDDLPDRIDYVVITHNHQDHVLFETLLQIRHKVGAFIVPRNNGGQLQDPSLKLILQNCGFKNVLDVDEFEEIDQGDFNITGLPFLGEHADLDVKTKMAWLVRIGKTKLLFAADSCNIEPQLYRHIHNCIGDIDALFLGMECDGAPLSWLYGPLLTRQIERSHDQSRRLSGSNYEQALKIVDQFHCSEVYVYAMGQEPWLNYIMSLKYTDESRPIVDSNRLVRSCRERGITAERLFGEKEMTCSA
jgi:L-ascorbate metabolism protein UlaG (beta-lactamase superfamily)